MGAHAAAVDGSLRPDLDVEPFHALQRWLETRGERRVVVPFAAALAKLVPSAAVRMRRDFRQVLTAIQAVALLHQRHRERTSDGAVVASVDDYATALTLLDACSTPSSPRV